MSARVQTGIIAIAGLVVGAGAFFWLHVRADRAQRSAASESELVAIQPAIELSQPAKTDGLPPSEPRKAAPAAAGELPRTGEVLEFAADVSKLSKVANLRLQVLERRDFLGKSAWHLQAFAHTENPLRMIFELDDQFDSYSEAKSFSSLQYEMHLNERGQKQDSIQRLVSAGNDPSPTNVTATRVLPGTRDPLGLMQYLRNVDWSKTYEVRSPVYDGHKLYDVRTSIATASQNVSVAAGNFQALKLDIHVFENGTEMKDARFALYLANNAFRTPVLLEAVLPFATARVELVNAK